MALASCCAAAFLAAGCLAKAQTCPATPPLQSIFIYNDTPRYIFAELEAGLTGTPTAPGSDIWMQAICKVPDSQTGKLTYPQTITDRFYINPTTGIPPGDWVEIQIPLFTQLAATVDPTAQNQYAEWWQGVPVSGARTTGDCDEKLDACSFPFNSQVSATDLPQILRAKHQCPNDDSRRQKQL